MTQERARKVYELCRMGIGPWSDNLRHFLTDREKEEVSTLWAQMPGYTTFTDAFLRFLAGTAQGDS